MKREKRPIALEPPPTQAATRSGSLPSTASELGRGLVADHPLQVPHQGRVRVGSHRAAQDIVGGRHVRDPVAHRVVHRVLQGRGPGRHRAHFGAERAHPQDVGALAVDVHGAHEDDAGQAEEGAGRGRGHAVLAGAGLGDHARLAQAPRQERLPERVVDLVRAGVGQVLALQVDAKPGRQRCSPGQDPGALDDLGREPVGAVEGRRTSRIRREETAQLGPEDRIVAEARVGILELAERGHERLGDVAAAERPVQAPAAGCVGIEQAGVGNLGPGGYMGSVEAGCAGTLREQSDGQRILRGSLARGGAGAPPRTRRRPRRQARPAARPRRLPR